jgi:hypothetical protein
MGFGEAGFGEAVGEIVVFGISTLGFESAIEGLADFAIAPPVNSPAPSNILRRFIPASPLLIIKIIHHTQ